MIASPEIAVKSAFAADTAVPASIGDAAAEGRTLSRIGGFGADRYRDRVLVDRLISASNLTLIYVLPEVITASAFGLGPSLVAVGVGSIAYDFFFTEPYCSLTMTNPPEIWAVVMLVTIVTSVSATSRLRAL